MATTMRRSLLVAALLLVSLLAVLAVPPLRNVKEVVRAEFIPPASQAPYHFVAADGRYVPRWVLRARPTAWIFGFTRCGEPCEILMGRVDELANRLGADADKLNFVFVSIDPTRDSPEVLQGYLAGRNPRLIGLISSRITAKHMASHFRVAYTYGSKVRAFPDFADLTRIFLTNQAGKLIEAVELDEALDTGIEELRRVMPNSQQRPSQPK